MDKLRLIAAQLLNEDEGRRQFVYKDSLGYWTIGVGRCVDQRKGRGISNDEIDYMLQNDITLDMDLARKDIPSFDSLSDNRKAVLISMEHQLGSLAVWPTFRSCIAREDWDGAHAAGMDSKWARSDSPARAKRLMDMLLAG